MNKQILKKSSFKITAAALTAVLAGGTIGVAYSLRPAETPPAACLTEVQTGTASAQKDILSNKTVKDETVYVIANEDGSPGKVIVSSWLKNTGGLNRISDMSNLSGIVNVKGDEKYSRSAGHMLEWEANGKDIYYQGTSTATLPVELNITYKLDGRTVSAKELEGKSGRVTIRYDYVNNEKRRVTVNGRQEEMYVPFVVVTGMMLDNETFSNVKVSNGKVINDGTRSICMGFALPGMQKSLGLDAKTLELPDYVEITADVTAYKKVDAVTVAVNNFFSGIDEQKLSSGNMEDALGALNSAMRQLLDGSAALYEGTSQLLEKSVQLAEGVNALEAGAFTLKDGTQQIYKAAVELAGGAKDLAAGTRELKAGTQELLEKTGILSAGMARVYQGTQQVSEGLGQLTASNDTLNSGARRVFENMLASATGQLRQAGLVQLPELTVENYDAVLTAAEAQAGGADTPAGAQIAGVKQQMDSYNEFYQGLLNYTRGVEQTYQGARQVEAGARELSNSGALLTDGAAGLDEGAQKLQEGSLKLADGAVLTRDGAGQTAQGMQALYDGIFDMKKGGQALVDGVGQLNSGAMQLSDGLQQFDREGMGKIMNLLKEDVGNLTERIKIMIELSGEYTSFSGKAQDAQGNVKFIYRN